MFQWKCSNVVLFILLSAVMVARPAIAETVEIVRGINYDPIHSLEFASAMGHDDMNAMKQAIKTDLDKLAWLQNYNNGKFKNINHVRTFVTLQPSLNHSYVNLADIVNEWNIEHPQNHIMLALGVWEYQPWDGCLNDIQCKEWTEDQKKAAIDAANLYGPQFIDRIIVGNENIDGCLEIEKQNTYCADIRKRIVEDILFIKNAVKYSKYHQLEGDIIKVGTTQKMTDVRYMLNPELILTEKDPNKINVADIRDKYLLVKKTADFIGANIYPYWSGSDYGPSANFKNSPAKIDFLNEWRQLQNLANVDKYEVIVTEEGWPSDGDPVKAAIPNADSQHDYFHYWYKRDTASSLIVPVSYYFSLFDKLPGAGAESHWGIFSVDRNSSILDANFAVTPKPLASGHVLVDFDNEIAIKDKTPIATLSACDQDWDANTKSQGYCYPIYGYQTSGDISSKATKKFMVDTTGTTYKSLKVDYYDDANQAVAVCYINFSVLSQFKNQSSVRLEWLNADGSAPCWVKPG